MKTILNQYSAFGERTEGYRSYWAAAALMVQANIIVPLFLYSIMLFHGGDWQVLLCAAGSMAILVSVLSAQSAKVIITVFALNALVVFPVILTNFLR